MYLEIYEGFFFILMCMTGKIVWLIAEWTNPIFTIKITYGNFTFAVKNNHLKPLEKKEGPPLVLFFGFMCQDIKSKLYWVKKSLQIS